MAKAGPDEAKGPWHQMVKLHLAELQGLKVCEAGCGLGGLTKYLCERGAQVVASDLSTVAVAETKKLLADFPQARVCVADLQHLPFPSDEFDLVVCCESFEHVPDQDQGLRELVRITRPGGRLVMTTPNYTSMLGLYRAYRDWVGRPIGEIGQPPRKPLNLVGRIRRLKKFGCRIDVVDGVGHYLLWPRTNPIRLKWLDRPRWLMRWVAAHSLTVTTKLRMGIVDEQTKQITKKKTGHAHPENR
jgi:SAM-dependent methyltransferase